MDAEGKGGQAGVFTSETLAPVPFEETSPLPAEGAGELGERPTRDSGTFDGIAIGRLLEDIEPLADRVLIRPTPEADMKGGLYIPEAAKEKPVRGVVLAVGPGKRSEQGSRVAMTLEVGQVVIYGKYSGIEVQSNGETVLLIREQDVMGRVVVRPGSTSA